MPLSDKQARFVAEYLIDLNATQAAIRAGYSPATAKQQGSRLLTDADVQEAVGAGQAERAKRTEITADMVLQELRKIGFSDIRKAARWGSRLVPRVDDPAPEGESLEEQPHGGALRRRRKGDDGTDAYYVTTVEAVKSDDLDDDTAAAIAEVSQTKDGVKIKMHDKRAALVDMGRHLGMFTDRVELSGSVNAQVTAIEWTVVDPQAPGS